MKQEVHVGHWGRLFNPEDSQAVEQVVQERLCSLHSQTKFVWI